jgi:hypothetical protein
MGSSTNLGLADTTPSAGDDAAFRAGDSNDTRWSYNSTTQQIRVYPGSYMSYPNLCLDGTTTRPKLQTCSTSNYQSWTIISLPAQHLVCYSACMRRQGWQKGLCQTLLIILSACGGQEVGASSNGSGGVPSSGGAESTPSGGTYDQAASGAGQGGEAIGGLGSGGSSSTFPSLDYQCGTVTLVEPLGSNCYPSKLDLPAPSGSCVIPLAQAPLDLIALELLLDCQPFPQTRGGITQWYYDAAGLAIILQASACEIVIANPAIRVDIIAGACLSGLI